jgi:hypothetical protein
LPQEAPREFTEAILELAQANPRNSRRPL